MKQLYAFKLPLSSTRVVGSKPYNKSHHVGWNILQASSIRTDTENGVADGDTIVRNEAEIVEYAKSVGVEISLSTLGPGYRAVARADHDPEQILGYCEGFIRPAGNILHVDKCEVWTKALDRAKKENPDGFKNGGSVFGVSLLLGYICLLHGYNKKCKTAEFLAIDDEAFQHKRLVRFFKRAGFKVIRYVGDDLASVPDRLVWGGCGTLMNREIKTLLTRWSKVLQF